MKHDDIVKILAPCGLDCMKCQMSADGTSSSMRQSAGRRKRSAGKKNKKTLTKSG